MQHLTTKPSWMRLAAVGVIACTLAACGSDKKDNIATNSSSLISSSLISSSLISSSVNSSSLKSSSISSSSSSVAALPLVGSLTLGKTYVDSNCSSCHGVNGVGNSAPALNTGKTTFVKAGVSYTLAAYISKYMPLTSVGSCDAQCAANAAAYISNGYSDTYPVVQKVGYTLQKIDNCGSMETPSSNSYVIYDNTVNNVVGWSKYAEKPSYATNLSLTADDYKVPGKTAVDSTCNMQKTQNLVLIKKYADWDSQHTNGIEVPLTAANKTFGNADKIVIEMKLNSARSKILDKTALKAIYKDTLTDVQYDELDQAKAAFGVSFLNPLQPDSTIAAQVEFQRFIELDPAIYNDKWVRVTISIADMDMFTNYPWVRKPTTLTEQATTMASVLRINPEVYGSRVDNHWKWGNVIRNFVPDNSDAGFKALNLPEKFKEMDITVKKIEVIWK